MCRYRTVSFPIAQWAVADALNLYHKTTRSAFNKNTGPVSGKHASSCCQTDCSTFKHVFILASIKYRIYKNVSAAGEKDKYYARAFHDETVGLEELAKHMSEHNTPYSPGTIHGVLKDMVACVRELLLDSKKVKLDNLAIFSLGLSSKPADSPAEFTVAGNIIKAYINALGTGEISKKQLDMTARFKEVVTYNRGESTLTNPDTNAGGSQTGSGSDTGAGGSQTGSGSDTGAGGSQSGSGSDT